MALLVFAVTLFVSAFILFLVQPIIGKLILPRLGGTPQVWNTCMVFFQMVLLAGYAYTHSISTKLRLRSQLIFHGILLLVPFFFLFFMGSKPFDVSSWNPPPGANPLFATLGVLAVIVGIPFFVVSTSAPLLQKWFAYTGHPASKDPYFLYGASNLGSLLSLWLYPALVEPFMKLQVKPDEPWAFTQTWMWAFSYVALVGLVLVCVGMVWKPSSKELRPAPTDPQAPDPGSSHAPSAAQATSTAVTASPPMPSKQTGIKKGSKHGPKVTPRKEPFEIDAIRASDEVTTWRRLRWVALAAIPSSMMLGVTTHMTTDLSPIPLFWLLPLSLYLLSFIFVFSRWPVPWVGMPHTYMLYLQPVFIALMIYADFFGAAAQKLFPPITCNLLGFFCTALVCHGEMAKDRPSTKHLTEFYLMMSLGGMIGGMFNGLIAPLLFIRVWEFPIAIIAACLVRPKLRDGGWSDDLVAGVLEQPAASTPHQKGAKGAPVPAAAATPLETTSTAMDFILPVANTILLIALVFVLRSMVLSIASSLGGNSEEAFTGMRYFLMFGIVLVISCFYFGRPIRYGLTVAAVLLVHGIMQSSQDSSIYEDRSYFGVIRIKISATEEALGRRPYSTLIHGHINHGMNLLKPANEKDWGDSDKDYSRLATTYYHRLGPAGLVMEKFSWWGAMFGANLTDVSMLNKFQADARMPASLIGAAAAPMGMGNLPVNMLVDLWSEPPFATIGLGTGTMASYGRPYQHVHYYEIDNQIRKLSLPLAKGQSYFTRDTLLEAIKDEPPFTHDTYAEGSKARPKTYFTYLKDAILRGSEVQVLMGDARLRMALPYKNHHQDPIMGGGPDNFYHMMVVDAFTSDAIPAHLLTKEAFQMYFKKLTEDGILCVHTSNRYVELPKVVADIATDLGYAYRRGHDAPHKTIASKQIGHFTSEWVMVARKAEYMKHLSEPRGYKSSDERHPEAYWTTPASSGGRYLWTDDYYNLLSIIRW